MLNLTAPVGEEEALGNTCTFDPFPILLHIAVHQAGHVVASVLLGRQTTSDVTMPPGGLAGGCAFYPSDRTQADLERSPRKLAEIRATIVLSGASAEAVIVAAETRPAGDADRRIAAEILARSTGFTDEVPTIATLLRIRSERLFDTLRARGAVFALADALIDQISIPAFEALRIITATLYGPEASVPTRLRDRSVRPVDDDWQCGYVRRARRFNPESANG